MADTPNPYQSSTVTIGQTSPYENESLLSLDERIALVEQGLDIPGETSVLNTFQDIAANSPVGDLPAADTINPSPTAGTGFFGALRNIGGAVVGGGKKFFSPTIDEEAQVATDAPFVGIATGLGALGNIYLGKKQLDQAEDVFKFNRKLAIANFTQQQNAASTNIFNKARNEALLAGKTQAEANQIGDRAVDRSGVKKVNIG